MVLIHRSSVTSPPRSKQTTPIKEKGRTQTTRSKFLKDPKQSVYAFDLYTFTFNKRQELNERLTQHFQKTKINKSILYGMFIYNCIGLTAVMYKDIYLSTDLYDGLYGIFGYIFLFTVLFVHATFFTLYYIESLDTDKIAEDNRKNMVNIRTIVMNVYIVTSLCVCGVIMNARIPYTSQFYHVLFGFGTGAISLEPFIVGCFLSVFHHSLFPVHWGVVIMAWFLQLCLVLYSVLPTAEPQTYTMNFILIFFYIATTTLNYRIHADKVNEFIETIKEEDDQRVKEEDMKNRVIAEYLAGSYGPSANRQAGIGNDGNMDTYDGSSMLSGDREGHGRNKGPDASVSDASVSTTRRGRGLASIATVSTISYLSERYPDDHSNSDTTPLPPGPFPKMKTRPKSGEEAIALARQALQINTRMHGAKSRQVASNILSLADVLRSFNNDVENSEIIHLYEQSIAIFKSLQGNSCVNVAVTENQLGNAYLARAEQARDANDLEREQVNLELALPHYREAARILKVNNHVDSVNITHLADDVELDLESCIAARESANAGNNNNNNNSSNN